MKNKLMSIGRSVASAFSPRLVLGLALLALFGFAPSAMADTDVTQLVTDASTLWDSVKVVVLGILGFSLLISIAVMVKKRR